jgi:hypothetical protein
MPIAHLPADSDPNEVAATIAADGAVIVDALAAEELLDAIAE